MRCQPTKNLTSVMEEYSHVSVCNSQDQWPDVYDENSPKFLQELGKQDQDKESVKCKNNLSLNSMLEVSQDVCLDEINSTLAQLTSNIKRLLADH